MKVFQALQFWRQTCHSWPKGLIPLKVATPYLVNIENKASQSSWAWPRTELGNRIWGNIQRNVQIQLEVSKIFFEIMKKERNIESKLNKKMHPTWSTVLVKREYSNGLWIKRMMIIYYRLTRKKIYLILVI